MKMLVELVNLRARNFFIHSSHEKQLSQERKWYCFIVGYSKRRPPQQLNPIDRHSIHLIGVHVYCLYICLRLINKKEQ